jgi:hypothetical protein
MFTKPAVRQPANGTSLCQSNPNGVGFLSLRDPTGAEHAVGPPGCYAVAPRSARDVGIMRIYYGLQLA